MDDDHKENIGILLNFNEGQFIYLGNIAVYGRNIE
jgi:hypothetical protein